MIFKDKTTKTFSQFIEINTKVHLTKNVVPPINFLQFFIHLFIGPEVADSWSVGHLIGITIGNIKLI